LRHRAMWRTRNEGQKRSGTGVEIYPHVTPISSTQNSCTAAPLIPILRAQCHSATRKTGPDDITPVRAIPAGPCRGSWQILHR
jgi:hypothetical protein